MFRNARTLGVSQIQRMLMFTFISGCFVLVVAATATVSARTPTKGPIPQAAFEPGVAWLDPALVPDFIPALGHKGEVVGYVARQALLDPPAFSAARTSPGNIVVYADDLATVVGYMVPGKGYVPLGVDPETVPSIPFVAAPAP
jgi:hypothetical protein